MSAYLKSATFRLAEGTTRISAAVKSPEVSDLARELHICQVVSSPSWANSVSGYRPDSDGLAYAARRIATEAKRDAHARTTVNQLSLLLQNTTQDPVGQ